MKSQAQMKLLEHRCDNLEVAHAHQIEINDTLSTELMASREFEASLLARVEKLEKQVLALCAAGGV